MSSKLSRSVLKGIVKECIIEIMEESFFRNTSNSEMQERLNESMQQGNSSTQQSTQLDETHYSQRSSTAHRGKNTRHTYLDNIKYENKNKSKESDFEKKVETIAESMTGDPVLASILKDTALTTLQEQASAERGKHSLSKVSRGDAAAQKVQNTEPSQLFGEEASSKWAKLAFAGS
jgi:hypothetical protein